MKWVGLIITIALILPLSWWLRRNPGEAPKLWMLMGFLPFALTPFHLYMAVLSWADWPGYVKGVEFSVLDALALALYVSLPGPPRSVPFRLSMALYFVAVLLSVFQASIPMAALFYPWQLARMFLVYAVVSRGCTDPRVAPALMRGMAVGLFMNAGVAVWQRFGLGELQTGGIEGSQNLLGLISHLVVFPFFALLLVRRGWLPAAVILAGVTVEMLTTSRATVGLAAFGYAAVLTLSALRHLTSRKAQFLLVALAAAPILVPLAYSSIEKRGGATLESSDAERVALKTAAGMMLSDHPWGVGANNYVLVANVDGYNDKAGVAPTAGSMGANVHNVYWLVAAETGYAGLITFVILLLRPLIVAFQCAARNRVDARGDLMLGLGVGLLVVYIHALFEWIFFIFDFQYIFAMELGLVAGLAQQLGYWRRTGLQGELLGVGTSFSTRPSWKTRGLSRRTSK